MKQLKDKIYYTGVNDCNKRLFESLWPVPDGVSYNSYLLDGTETVLFDTVDICFSNHFLSQISEILNSRELNYLIVNHVEPDHSGCISLLREKYPKLKIIGNKQTFAMLAGYYGIVDGLIEVHDGDMLEIGERSLRFVTAPMVHWPEVMFTYDETDRALFSADAFGTFGALYGGTLDTEIDTDRFWNEMVRYYSNIVGKYGNPVQKALSKLQGVDIQMICPTHGPVWTEKRAQAIAIYDRLSRYEGLDGLTIVYGSMYGHTERMAEIIAAAASEHGVKNIAFHNVSNSHASYVLRDVFNYKGLIIGSPTYSNQLFPEIDSLLHRIELRELRNRLYGCFGSYTWAGAAVKRLIAFGETMKWDSVGEPVEQKQNISTEQACRALGHAMARRLKS
jgi:flavorubredoxin